MRTFSIKNYEIKITEKSDFDNALMQYPACSHLIRCKQIHSNLIHEYHSERKNETPGDGIFSDQKNIPLTVGVSDCNAVVIMGAERYGILHAGWAGLKEGIISKMFEKLTELGESEFSVFVGPSIRTCCYEVGEEFTEWVDAKYLQENIRGRYQFDMIAMIQDLLREYPCKQIQIHPSCTKCSSNFWSYRRGDGINNFITIEKY